MSPYGGRNVLGVTPVTSLMTFIVHPSSATTSSFVSVVSDECAHVCTDSWCPSMYSVWTISGREMAREPTMKKVDLRPCDSRRLRRRGVYGEGPSSA